MASQTTEFEDILRDKGILPPLPAAAPVDDALPAATAIGDAITEADVVRIAEAAVADRFSHAPSRHAAKPGFIGRRDTTEDEEEEEEDFDDILQELEDELKDDHKLQEYRAQRVREMRERAATARFGSVQFIQRPEYTRDVTDASRDGPVVVLLFKDRYRWMCEWSERSAVMRDARDS